LNQDGVHNLCDARRELGNPTPSLGRPCKPCGGQGNTSTLKSGQALYDPSGAALDAAFPMCRACDGTGVAY
jgi:hypothetical protein